MKKLYTLVLLTYTLLNLQAQTNWKWQNPMPQGNTLSQVQVIDDNTIVAVGQLGTFIKSTNSGTSWDVKHYVGGVPGNLQSVYFTDPQNGWAIDYAPGYTYHTTNGGNSWDTLFLHNQLNKVYFNKANGFIIGDTGVAYRLIDGTWEPISQFSKQQLVDIQFTTVDTGFILAQDGSIYMSVDTGNTWEGYISAPITNTDFEFYRAFYVFNSSNIKAVGRTSLAFSTTDGGYYWDTAVIYFPEDMQDVYFIDEDTGIAVGGYRGEQYGDIFRTTDGGKSWESVIRPNFWPKSIAFIDDLRGIIVGLGGEIFTTDNGGRDWTGNPDYNTGFAAVDLKGDNGIIIGAPTYGPTYGLLSANRGKTWAKGANLANQPFFDVAFATSSTAIAVGGYGHIMRTTDAGASWIKIELPPLVDTTIYYFGVTFPTADTGYIAGAFGTILKTVDRGLTWEKLPINTLNNFANIAFADAENGMVLQDLFPSGFVTHDGGQTWDSIQMGPELSGAFNSLHFIDKDTVIAVGYYYPGSFSVGLTCRSTNGGDKWTQLQDLTLSELNDVHFSGRDSGTIVGSLGAILQSVDAGQTWELLLSPVASDLLNSVKMLSGTEGTMVGQNAILHQAPGIISYIPEPLPAQASLLGNVFPNPVNGKAQFKLALPANQQVKLSVRNILGEEVQLIATQKLNAGTYTIEWAPVQGLANGTYFIQLETGGITESKKVVLVR